MIGPRILSIAFVCALAMPVSASKAQQIRTVQLGHNDAATLQLMSKFGRCVARAKRSAVVAVLARDPKDPGFHQTLRRLSQERSTCVPVGGVMIFNDAAIASAMAEWMLQHDYPGDTLGTAIAARASAPATPARDDVERVSQCVIRAAPVQTAGVFATTPATPEEEVSLRALSDALVSCVATGQSLRLGKPTLRSGLALASYRLMAPSPATGTR